MRGLKPESMAKIGALQATHVTAVNQSENVTQRNMFLINLSHFVGEQYTFYAFTHWLVVIYCSI